MGFLSYDGDLGSQKKTTPLSWRSQLDRPRDGVDPGPPPMGECPATLLRMLSLLSRLSIFSWALIFFWDRWVCVTVSCSEAHRVSHKGRACGRCCFSLGGWGWWWVKGELWWELQRMKPDCRRLLAGGTHALLHGEQRGKCEMTRCLRGSAAVLDSDWLCQLSRIPFSEVPARSRGRQTGSDCAAVFTHKPPREHELWQQLGGCRGGRVSQKTKRTWSHLMKRFCLNLVWSDSEISAHLGSHLH